MAACFLISPFHNEVVSETLSPDGKFKAVVFQRKYSDSTIYYTDVSIIPAKNKLPNDPGNVASTKSKAPLTVKWESKNRLRVIHDAATKVFFYAKAIEGVVILDAKKP